MNEATFFDILYVFPPPKVAAHRYLVLHVYGKNKGRNMERGEYGAAFVFCDLFYSSAFHEIKNGPRLHGVVLQSARMWPPRWITQVQHDSCRDPDRRSALDVAWAWRSCWNKDEERQQASGIVHTNNPVTSSKQNR